MKSSHGFAAHIPIVSWPWMPPWPSGRPHPCESEFLEQNFPWKSCSLKNTQGVGGLPKANGSPMDFLNHQPLDFLN
jgi:hypothetical protein